MAHQEWLNRQYGKVDPLATRIRLHRECSENPEDWYRWAFSFMQERLPQVATVLEIGGGKGDLWTRNAERIPAGWQITVTDRSEGLVQAAHQACASDPRFTFSVVDAEQPLEQSSDSLDAVVANHVLYHLNQTEVFLREAARVIKESGFVFASVTATDHLQAMYDLASRFDSRLGNLRKVGHTQHVFGGEGKAVWNTYFSQVEWIDHPDAFVIDEAHIPLFVEYVCSWTGGEEILRERGREAMIDFLGKEIQTQGTFRFPKKEGLYIAQR